MFRWDAVVDIFWVSDSHTGSRYIDFSVKLLWLRNAIREHNSFLICTCLFIQLLSFDIYASHSLSDAIGNERSSVFIFFFSFFFHAFAWVSTDPLFSIEHPYEIRDDFSSKWWLNLAKRMSAKHRITFLINKTNRGIFLLYSVFFVFNVGCAASSCWDACFLACRHQILEHQ